MPIFYIILNKYKGPYNEKKLMIYVTKTISKLKVKWSR
jgi:hypothetical protein